MSSAPSLEPLVEPAAGLTPQEVSRYARHLLVPDVGAVGQRRLKNARVLVVGAGGLGSPVLLYLAAAGVGTLGIVDPDVVEASNLQRQVVHGSADLGRLKVESARERVAAVNPLVRVEAHPVRLDSTNAMELLSGYDVVVDGTDNFPTRYLVNDACALLGIPCVWGSIYRFDGQASVWFAGHGPCYRCVFPEPPPPGLVPSCAEGGVLGVLCAAIGSIQATEVVKLVTGIGSPLVGRLVVHDALRATWRELSVKADPNCALCGGSPSVTGLVDYGIFCGMPSAATESVGHDVSAGVGERSADSVTARELADLLSAREAGTGDFVLVDVREPGEREVVSIPGAVAISRASFHNGDAWQQLPFDKRVILHCRSGLRSAECLALLRAAGHPDAAHVDGGVLAWVQDVDPSLPSY
ncbi:MAG: molybdopterin-synthase adenylyltransferase MoeB [Actinomycetota bacterium]|nr:molybdopterin-synthase adenylyltransferase MoeB [Actinomycetota bacterium]